MVRSSRRTFHLSAVAAQPRVHTLTAWWTHRLAELAFQPLITSMLRNWCTRSTTASGVSCAARAQVVSLSGPNRPTASSPPSEAACGNELQAVRFSKPCAPRVHVSVYAEAERDPLASRKRRARINAVDFVVAGFPVAYSIRAILYRLS